jgi:hypothetical protein
LFKNLFAFDGTDWAIVDRFFGRGFIINGTGFGFAIITEREDGWGSTDAETAGDAEVLINRNFAWHLYFLPKTMALYPPCQSMTRFPCFSF